MTRAQDIANVIQTRKLDQMVVYHVPLIISARRTPPTPLGALTAQTSINGGLEKRVTHARRVVIQNGRETQVYKPKRKTASAVMRVNFITKRLLNV